MSTRSVDLLEDASGDAAHPDRLRQRVAADGAALLRGILPVDAVQAVADDLIAVLRSSGWLSRTDGLRPQVAAVSAYDRDWWPTYQKAWSLESLHRLVHHPALWSTIEALFGEPIFNHPAKVLRIAFPEGTGGKPTEAHQDYSLLHATPDLLTCWIPLAPCSQERGGLQILRGSQNGGLRPSAGQEGRNAIFIDGDFDDPGWATADYEVGDVLLFHALTVHAALPNESGELRLSLDTRYQSVKDKVRPGVLGVHGSPPLPGWDVITQGWSTTKWVEIPDDVVREVNPFGTMPLAEQMQRLVIPPSRFVTVSA